jgi:hypothetical protein
VQIVKPLPDNNDTPTDFQVFFSPPHPAIADPMGNIQPKKRSHKEKTISVPPYSMRRKIASEHFGLAEPTLYQWVSNGRLPRRKHYLKVGGGVVIIRDSFVDFMMSEGGSFVGTS